MSKRSKRDGVRETLSSVYWVFRLFWSISPGLTISTLLTGIILEVESVVNTYIFAKGIDIILEISAGEREFVWIYYFLAIYLAITIFRSGIQLIANYTDRMLNIYFGPRFHQLLYEKLIRIGIQHLEDPETNNLIERARNNAGRVHRQFDISTRFVGLITALLSSGIVLLAFAPHFLPLFIITLIPSLLVDKHYLSKLWKHNRDLTEDRRKALESAGYLQDSKALHELSITGGHKFLSEHYASFIQKWATSIRRMRGAWYRFLFGFRVVRAGVEGYAAYYVFTKFIQKTISIGEVTFFVRQANSFMSNISNLANITNNLYEQSLYVSETKELFNKPDRLDGNYKFERFGQGPTIEFKKVSFTYPNAGRKVIKDLNLKIKSGEKVAIVGENGAGKTTLIKLLMRFYKAGSGEVTINGVDVNALKIDDYYKNVSVLFQDFNTYRNLTVKDNITIGKISKKFSQKDLERASKYADIEEFVNSYPNKYDQVLSEKYKGGTRPSTGQWQKIAIARFFYRDAPLVIFDEPTAAIDAVSEQNIFDKIYKSFKNKTVIIISHRFSTVRNADRIIVFDNGKIVEHGSHEELMSIRGKYYKAFQIQAKGYK
jgi:ATP-binding cassette subfamily B protein